MSYHQSGKFLIFFLFAQFAIADLSTSSATIAMIKEMNVGLEDSDNSPFEYLSKNENSGFHVDVVRQVAKKMGYQVVWHRLPWARALINLEKGELDAVSYLSANPERDKYILFLPDNLLSYSEICLFTKVDSNEKINFTGDLHQLKKYKFGYLKDYFYSKKIIQAKSYLRFEDFPGTSSHQFDQLLGSRFDIMFMAPARYDELKKTNSSKASKIRILKPCLKSDDAYIGFSKVKDPQIAQKFALTMKSFKKTKEYGQLLKKYNLQYLESLSR